MVADGKMCFLRAVIAHVKYSNSGFSGFQNIEFLDFQDFENTEIQDFLDVWNTEIPDVPHFDILRFRIFSIFKILRFWILNNSRVYADKTHSRIQAFDYLLFDSLLTSVCLFIAWFFDNWRVYADNRLFMYRLILCFCCSAWFCLFTHYVDFVAWRVHGHASWSSLRTVSRWVGELQTSDGCVKQVFQLYFDIVLKSLFVHKSYEFIRVYSVGGRKSADADW